MSDRDMVHELKYSASRMRIRAGVISIIVAAAAFLASARGRAARRSRARQRLVRLRARAGGRATDQVAYPAPGGGRHYLLSLAIAIAAGIRAAARAWPSLSTRSRMQSRRCSSWPRAGRPDPAPSEDCRRRRRLERVAAESAPAPTPGVARVRHRAPFRRQRVLAARDAQPARREPAGDRRRVHDVPSARHRRSLQAEAGEAGGTAARGSQDHDRDHQQHRSPDRALSPRAPRDQRDRGGGDDRRARR